jgi:AraC family transcriptional regulator, regulatory protein of adaptative response / DNA-3-methyladenine glycosylase II
MTEDSKYEAVCSRDARFDGEFFFAVRTTGVYCRPSCPATTPRRRNVRFFRTAVAAQACGFRACRRCRPDAVPGSAEWNARADVVGRAMRMIGDGVVDREGAAGLAARLGYSARQVRRQLNAELGAGPVALARAQRAHTARILLRTTGMPAADIAFAAGFASVRQFNDTMREIYAATPTQLRSAAAPKAPSASAGVPLRLAYRGPYAAPEVFGYLARRAVTGVEEVVGAPGTRTYRCALRLPHGCGIVEVDEKPARGVVRTAAAGWLDCRVRLGEPRDLTTAIHRVRRLFDLDADPLAVAERLGGHPALAPLVAARPGLRSPGAADPRELAVRAVLGQQVSVSAGRRLGAALVAGYGRPLPEPSGGLTHLFPASEDLADASLDVIGMPERRREAVRALSAALADGTVDLDAGAARDQAEKDLLSLPGIGPWTAGYIRMRALGDPDVLLEGDAAVRAGARRAGAELQDCDTWRPWRSYAMHHLWNHCGKGPAL